SETNALEPALGPFVGLAHVSRDLEPGTAVRLCHRPYARNTIVPSSIINAQRERPDQLEAQFDPPLISAGMKVREHTCRILKADVSLLLGCHIVPADFQDRDVAVGVLDGCSRTPWLGTFPSRAFPGPSWPLAPRDRRAPWPADRQYPCGV